MHAEPSKATTHPARRAAPDESVAQALEIVSAVLDREGGSEMPARLAVLGAELTGEVPRTVRHPTVMLGEWFHRTSAGRD